MKTPLWMKRLILVLAILATAEGLYLLALKLFASDPSSRLAHLIAFGTPIPILVLSTLVVMRLKPIIWMLLFAVMVTPTEAGSFCLLTPDNYSFPPQSTNEVWVYPDASILYYSGITNTDKAGNTWLLRWDNTSISNFLDPGTNTLAWNIYCRTNDQSAWTQIYFCQTGWVSFNLNLIGPAGAPWSSNCVYVTYDQWGHSLSTNWGKAVMDDQQSMTMVDSNGIPVLGNVTKGWGGWFFPDQSHAKFILSSPSLATYGLGQQITFTNGVPGTSGIQPMNAGLLVGVCCVCFLLVGVIVVGCKVKKLLEPICKNQPQQPQGTNNPAPPPDDP